ncbi:hypothetical protein CVT25_013390 [Psilocybe cyanescens]|uniref:Uncharacterized protein n=1 Tax=Psilocybe cyanescens TaxID=93625 RepID=A0A409WSV0_PSICY|nr:hypothetical protein CVT25_013390 [Psilocybe cyanescens]
MPKRGHKRKRSILPDSTVNLSQMNMAALSHLEALKDALDGIQETEMELKSIPRHDPVLEDILKGVKTPRMNFSTVISEDLNRAGVVGKCLMFEPVKVIELANTLTANAEAEISNLHSRIKKIYYDPGPRMILDAILLALTEIASAEQRSVAILPEMRIPQGHEVQITHPVSGYGLRLSGNFDYAIIEYENTALSALVVSRGRAINISKGRLLLVQAKYKSSEENLVSHIPEAVNQGIALLKSANLPEVRFCLSDGQSWIFFILKLENGSLTYYESATHYLERVLVERSDMQLREIVQLMCEWLQPSATDLFSLE